VRDIRVLLIGGTSHVGKSTLAQALASELGWDQLSTDRLARHPGRPWTTGRGSFPQHLATHYLSMSIGELATEQLRHYERLWPRTEELVRAHATNTGVSRLIIEGSGILPERIAALKIPNIAAVWLTASDSVLKDRIYSASRYYERTAVEMAMVDKFLGRSERYNQFILNAARRLGAALIDTSAAPSTSELIKQCLQVIG